MAQEARQRLNRARPIDTLALIEAFRDTQHPPFVRLAVGDALRRIYLRDENRRVLFILIEAVADSDAEMRAAVAATLKELRPVEAVGALIHQFVGETNDRVRFAILDALEEIAVEDDLLPFSWRLNTDLLVAENRPDDKIRFTRALQQLQREPIADSLRSKSLEWLELLADEKAAEAWEWLEKGDRRWAEKLMLTAREIVPDSKGLNWQLGHLYFSMGDRDTALRTMRDAGLLVTAVALPSQPSIDGLLTEPAWKSIRPQTQFYRCEWSRRARPDSGQVELYVGHHDGDLFVGYKVFEPSTKLLTATAAIDDQAAISRDDGIELFFDVNHDLATYFHIAANSLGSVTDQFNAGKGRRGDVEWNGAVVAMAHIGEGDWSLELRLPAHRLANSRISAGDVWGFNAGRIRTVGGFTYAQWAPTYGSAHRPDRFGYLLFD